MSNPPQDEALPQDRKKLPPNRRQRKVFHCHCCRQDLPFCWNCPCGFQICPECFETNKWGISNGPTWICPDCGRIRMM